MAAVKSSNKPESHSNFAVDVQEALRIFRANRIQTIAYWATFLTFGLCVAVLGPTLLDLGCITKSTITQMSWVIFAQTGCTLLGSIFAGLFSSRLNANVILLYSTFGISVTMALVPLCETRASLLGTFVVMGLFMGQIDTVANIKLIQIYGNCVAPFLQALHFAYGLGAFLSPIIAEPFLNNEDCTDLLTDKKHMDEDKEELNNAAKSSNVGDAYLIYSIVQAPCILLLIYILIKEASGCCYSTDDDPKKTQKGYKELSGSQQGPSALGNGSESTKDIQSLDFDDLKKVKADPRAVSLVVTYSVIALIGLVMFVSDAAQAAYGGFVYSYAKENKEIEISATLGAYLTSTFWGAFALGRLFSIPLSAFISSPVLLFINLSGSGMAVVFFLVFRDQLVVLFICSFVFGLFLSSIYPSGIAMAEQYLSITGFMTGILVMSAASGEMMTPLLVGWLFDEVGPVALIYYEMAACISGLLFLLLAVVVAFRLLTGPASEQRPHLLTASICYYLSSRSSDSSSSEPIISRKGTKLHSEHEGGLSVDKSADSTHKSYEAIN